MSTTNKNSMFFVEEERALTRELEPGVYSFEIEPDAQGLVDPVAYVWLRNPSGQPGIVDAGGRAHAGLWQQLRGFNNCMRVRVEERTLYQGMCTERDGFERKGKVKIRRHPA